MNESDLEIITKLHSMNPQVRSEGVQAFVARLNQAHNLVMVSDGATNFLMHNRGFLTRARQLFRSEKAPQRRDGADMMSAIVHYTVLENSDSRPDLSDVFESAATLFNRHEPAAIIDGAYVLRAGLEHADHNMLAVLSENVLLYDRAAALYIDGATDKVQNVAADMLACFAPVNGGELGRYTGLANAAIARLNSKSRLKLIKALSLLENLTDAAGTLLQRLPDIDIGRDRPHLAYHFRLLPNAIGVYMRSDSCDRATGARLLAALSESGRAEEIAGSPGILDKTIQLINGRDRATRSGDPDIGMFLESLVSRGEAETVVCHPGMMNALHKLYDFTDRDPAPACGSREDELADAQGRGAENFALQTLHALIREGYGGSIVEHADFIHTAYDMLCCPNHYANQHGYDLLNALRDDGYRSFLITDYHDMFERLQEYEDRLYIPEIPEPEDESARSWPRLTGPR